MVVAKVKCTTMKASTAATCLAIMVSRPRAQASMMRGIQRPILIAMASSTCIKIEGSFAGVFSRNAGLDAKQWVGAMFALVERSLTDSELRVFCGHF